MDWPLYCNGLQFLSCHSNQMLPWTIYEESKTPTTYICHREFVSIISITVSRDQGGEVHGLACCLVIQDSATVVNNISIITIQCG